MNGVLMSVGEEGYVLKKDTFGPLVLDTNRVSGRCENCYEPLDLDIIKDS